MPEPNSHDTSSQLGSDAIAHPAVRTDSFSVSDHKPTLSPSQEGQDEGREPTTSTQLGRLAIADPEPENREDKDPEDADADADLAFADLPPFPNDVPTAPLLRIKLEKLVRNDEAEIDRLYSACCELGFFYLDLRGEKKGDGGRDRDGRGGSHDDDGQRSPEQEELTKNVWRDAMGGEETDVERGESHGLIGDGNEGQQDDGEGGDEKDKQKKGEEEVKEVEIDGEQLLRDADALFDVGKQIFDLPVEEKVKYDFKDLGSYFGYKGYGDGIIDSAGTRDRNEFYNASKDDLLSLSSPLPAPPLLTPHRPLLTSYIRHSHALVSLLLRHLTTRLGLAPGTLQDLHRLDAVSGDQVRWVCAPPQPPTDRTTALGEHTDFGSVTILFNRLGGLQVLPPSSAPTATFPQGSKSEWSYVRPLRGHAVVNLGDAMVKFTAGVLRSNIHRVVAPPGAQAGRARMSLVYFARPEDRVVLRCLEGSGVVDGKRRENEKIHGKGDGKGEEEEEITAKEWILRRALGRRTGGDWSRSGGTEGDRVK